MKKDRQVSNALLTGIEWSLDIETECVKFECNDMYKKRF